VAWRSTAAIATGAALGFPSLFGARFMLGLGEAGAFPVASRAMQTWFAKSERGRIQGIVHFFSRFALAITPLVSGSILLALGWRWIFYIFGSMGILWAVVFFAIFRDHPEDHPGVNAGELAEIRGLNPDGTTKALDRSRPPTPWKHIVGSPNMWFIALGYGCFFFGSNFYLTWYPTYLREYRHLSIKSLGLLGSLPLFIGMTGDVVGGWLTDKIYHKTGNARLARRAVAAPAFVLAGAFSIPAAMTSDTLTCLLFIAASFFSLEMVIGPAWAVPMDVGGQFSGTVTGIMNMFGALAASMTALIYGYMFGKEMWVAPFVLSSGVMVLGALIWIFLIDPEKSVVEARTPAA
jgi:sugar phosphate permease